MQKEIKKKTTVYGMLAVLVATILGVACLNFGIRPFLSPSGIGTLSTFSSYDELENFLNTNQKTPYYKLIPLDSPRILLRAGETPSPQDFEVISGGVYVNDAIPLSGPVYSETNIQVSGVDEADLVKTDGEYMYVASGNNITILKVYPAEDAEIVSQMSLNGTVQEIFINDDKLAIFGESYFYQPVEAYYVWTDIIVAPEMRNESIPSPIQQMRVLPYNLFSTSGETFIKVYNVSDKANPSLTRDVLLNGTYFSSRMIGDYIYAVTSEPTLWQNTRVILPTITIRNETEKIQPSQIYYSKTLDNSYTFTTIVSINLKLNDTEPEHKTFLLGSASCMYVSSENIYITMLNQEFIPTTSTESTLVFRIHIQDGEIESEASGQIPGRVLNQFSMDEHNEYFRIATTTGQLWNSQDPSRNNIYVLNMSLSTVGKLENLAPTEEIYSARFIGDKCYLVTFRQVDPFFVIDLQNPQEPKALGSLKIPGYSSYLHPYDENHIIGIGKDAGKVKISLFDVSDFSAPEEVANYTTDYLSDSIALDDYKAFLFDKSRNLLVMPITEYQDQVTQGAYVFNMSAEGGITLRGIITHIDNNTTLPYYYYNNWNYVKRALYIDNVLYTVSSEKIKMNDLETLQEIKEVKLP